MPCRRPLQTTHPELTIIERKGTIEYRVKNQHLSRDGSGRTVYGFSAWTWLDALTPVILGVLWPVFRNSWLWIGALVLVLVLYCHSRLTQVLWESVLILPPHGIQLETHRGFPFLPLQVSRRFIPLPVLRDFVIHEGLRGWDVRYYLAAIMEPFPGAFCLAVAFEVPVLEEVYRAVQLKLLSPQLEPTQAETPVGGL